MAELQYKLMTSAVNNFDCGNPAINEYVENSYFATLLQQCYAYEIEYKSLVVGYYMITFRDVAFYDCISEISDYQIDDFGEFLPSLYINYLAIGTKYQKNKIGTKIQKNTKKLKKCLTRTGIICIIIFAVAIETAKTK